MADDEHAEVLKLQRKIEMLRTTNSNLVMEIESLGLPVELTMARVEHFFGNLVTLGVITELQQYQEQYSWEQHLRAQLVPMVQRVRKAPPRRAGQN